LGSFHILRFDDRLETALRNAGSNDIAASTQWRQLIDILARSPESFSFEQVSQGLVQARSLISRTEKEVRVASITTLPGKIKSPPLVQLLSGDHSSVGIAAIEKADLTDSQWAELVPHLPVRARGFMRNRSDLGPKTREALQIWSGADFVLPYQDAEAGVASPDVASDNVSDTILDEKSTETAVSIPPTAEIAKEVSSEPVPIGEIVERIERLRQARESGDSPELSLEGGKANERARRERPTNEIRFESDDFGVICWVEGVPEGAVVGVTIAQPAYDGEPGPDAYGASAFRQRMPIENARMSLLGSPLIEGDWRINAAPFFDSRSGRFKGYRGILRRPTVAEDPQIDPQQIAVGEKMQQLIHELRTPLGAIVGFSEIIEQQLFGPVAHDYRVLAQSILTDANKLLAGFDDLAIASKVDSDQLQIMDGVTHCDWLTSRLAERLSGLSENLDVTLNLMTADPVRPFAVENELVERIFSRLLSAVIIGCGRGEELGGRFHTEVGIAPVNKFTLALPDKLASMDEGEMLGSGPGNLDQEESAPLLGLGFSLRLVRNLARKVQGDLRFDNEQLLLTLPAVRDGGARTHNRER